VERELGNDDDDGDANVEDCFSRERAYKEVQDASRLYRAPERKPKVSYVCWVPAGGKWTKE